MLTESVRVGEPAVRIGLKELREKNEKLSEEHYEEVHGEASESTQSGSQELTPGVVYLEGAQIEALWEIWKDGEIQAAKQKQLAKRKYCYRRLVALRKP